MYNYFKYQQTVRLEQAQRRENQKYSQWLLKNQDIKEEAKQKQKLRLQDWVCSELKDGITNIVEDDHFKQWRFLKQFRDVQNQTHFKGYKTFRHKPSIQMDKYFNQRQSKQIAHLSQKKQSLIDNSLIHQFERSRSLRSQGPLNPKIQFRSKKKDEDYLNPRMRFHNVTDKERMNQTRVTFDDKFRSLYSSFQMTKSKIGKAKISFYKDQSEPYATRSKSNRDRYDVDMETEKSLKLKNSNNNKVYFKGQVPENQQNLTQSKQFSNGKFSQKMPQIHGYREPTRKTYFKLAKTMQIQGCKEIKRLLLQSQYDRKKNLSNIKLNQTCQSYFKDPVL